MMLLSKGRCNCDDGCGGFFLLGTLIFFVPQ